MQRQAEGCGQLNELFAQKDAAQTTALLEDKQLREKTVQHLTEEIRELKQEIQRQADYCKQLITQKDAAQTTARLEDNQLRDKTFLISVGRRVKTIKDFQPDGRDFFKQGDEGKVTQINLAKNDGAGLTFRCDRTKTESFTVFSQWDKWFQVLPED